MGKRSYSGAAAALALSGGTLASNGLTFTTTGTNTNWPDGSGGKFLLVIDRGTATEEKMLVTTRVTNTFTIASTADRGVDGTLAQSHLVPAAVEHCIGKMDVDEPNEHINDTTKDHHTQYMKTDGTRHDLLARHPASILPVLRTSFTFGVVGPVAVSVGNADVINPVFVPVASGRTAKIVGAKYILGTGTATVKVQINGVDATGLVGMNVITTASTASPTPISLADGDRISLVVTGVASSPQNMSFSIYLEHG